VDDKAFLDAIAEHWDDDRVRLVYADWLEERGDPRGEFLRLECQLAKLSSNDGRCQQLRDRFLQIGRTCDWHWLRSVSRVKDTWGVGLRLGEVVSRILAELVADPPRDRWERRLSAWLGAIPMGVDDTGDYMMLHPEGHLTYVRVNGESEADWLCSRDEEVAELGRCLRKARRRYPGLWSEMERLGAELPACPVCQRKRRHGGRVCDECGGLGWLIDTGM
jgi:uncharacterized protein (TIGR02996 family)